MVHTNKSTVAHEMKTLQCPLRTTRNTRAYHYADNNGGVLKKGGHLYNEMFSGRQPRHDVKVLKMETELVPETSKYLHIPTRLSARENFIEFRRCESLKT